MSKRPFEDFNRTSSQQFQQLYKITSENNLSKKYVHPNVQQQILRSYEDPYREERFIEYKADDYRFIKYRKRSTEKTQQTDITINRKQTDLPKRKQNQENVFNELIKKAYYALPSISQPKRKPYFELNSSVSLHKSNVETLPCVKQQGNPFWNPLQNKQNKLL